MFRLLKSTTSLRLSSFTNTPKRYIRMDNKTYGVSKNGIVMKVDLSEKEAKICSVLRGVSSFIAKERPELPIIESRIAGGWVRDKVSAFRRCVVLQTNECCSFSAKSAMISILPSTT